MAPSNGFSVACSKELSVVSSIFQRILSCPVDLAGIVQWIVGAMFQWNVFCEYTIIKLHCEYTINKVKYSLVQINKTESVVNKKYVLARRGQVRR